MPVEIKEIPLGGDLTEFLDVVDYIYRDDPNYVRPLDMEVRDMVSPKSPFFLHAEGVVFTAHRNGFCVGRCTAQIDRLHLERYQDAAGFFGFFDTVDDQEVASALIEAASGWLRKRGMRVIRGPFMMSTNDQVGCLVDGFDTPPAVMMPHHRAYQGGLIEGAGLRPLADAYAWRYHVGNVPRRAREAHDQMAAMPEVQTRNGELRHLVRDVRIMIDIYNDAWSENWGYIPITEPELKKLAESLRLILDPKITFITTIDGEPAACCIAVPDVNQWIGDLGGKLLPVGFFKFFYRAKVLGTTSARVIVLGIKKKFRVQKKYRALSHYLYTLLDDTGVRNGYQTAELSWTLADNKPVNLGIKSMGGRIYKTYRFYEKAL